ncbi:protein-glutamate methylesterase/protein-glutamine glutaminase [Candidatus Contubernalis alkaliaceticus]|uniref:protein-glutamate methylesterase/protein-glutamine glutaminase n=1 Tax=Candidatus Contubernalis alkaliaceticus TaxID=338645 RepID=UPI001F4BF4E3|nr:chemotaxis response regulator protein-glutamate methylesterase [Candidatus Contubernalis alkalaceticus]UNC91780.1 chemotaxis response regulator protein-glutamate methylesterase [Candidatus Contubernalis alkalaceticus]
MEQIKVLVVDDTALMRKIVSDIFGSSDEFQVVATARDGEDALKKIKRFKPDLITLDVEMPRMNGIEVLKVIMQDNPVPVIMLSSHTRRGSEITIEALSLGAVDFIPKPGYLSKDLKTVGEELLHRARLAARAKNLKISPRDDQRQKRDLFAVPSVSPRFKSREGFKNVVAIGSSTGGPKALEHVLINLPGDFPAPLIITQHMPPGFTNALAQRLDKICDIQVKEGDRGDKLMAGTAYIAPGGYHMVVTRDGFVNLNQDPPVEHVRPSANVMIDSAVQVYGDIMIGVILTGMGKDGAEAMVNIKEKGGRTVVQDEATSVIYRMPRAVVELGAADYVLPLEDIPKALIRMVGLKS